MKITAKIELPKKLTAKFKELKMPLGGGYEEGYDDGYKEGYVVGEGDGYTKGETDGRKAGYNEGYGKGYDEGYAEAGENSLTAEDLAFSGDVSYLFYKGKWAWIADKYADLISFNDITVADYLFAQDANMTDASKLHLNFSQSKAGNMFEGCKNLTKLPKVSGTLERHIGGIFRDCWTLTSNEINEFFNSLSYVKSGASPSLGYLFYYCYSVRDLTPTLEWLDGYINSYTSTNQSICNRGNWFNNCVALDEIINIPVHKSGINVTSNQFSGTFQTCCRVKNIMFKTDNGVPYTVNWKGQTIDLTTKVGSGYSADNFTKYNSGLTEDKFVRNDTTYHALKNFDDWFTGYDEYSRYNHDSAVNTINSLPDTSEYLANAGGTNTIKFKGSSGSKTDGGAINTLTAEEIAVATAKGWTVTFA